MDGNLVYEEGGGLATPRAYVYDAENRLIQVGPAGSPAVGDRRVTFAYDYRGRRVKQVGETWSGSGWISELRLFVWDGWKMLLERRLAQYGQPPPTRAYTWGLDLTGQRASGRGGRLGAGSLLEGAGTIGGLLAVADGTGGAGTLTYVYCYDANGNVGQVVDPAAANVTAALVATYEYDPYGGVLVSSGAYAATNPVRFSTKYWDDATGLGYWGYRFYRADLGRWVNRDPIEEDGGENLYAFVTNQTGYSVDAVGLMSKLPPCTDDGPLPVLPERPWCPDKLCSKICSYRFPGGGMYLGFTTCHGGKPCVCVCDQNIAEYSCRNRPCGPAQGIIQRCTEVHENWHAENTDDGRCAENPPQMGPRPGEKSDECAAETYTLQCLSRNADQCSGKDKCDCLQALYRTARQPCDTQHAGSPCPEDERTACERQRSIVRDRLRMMLQGACH